MAIQMGYLAASGQAQDDCHVLMSRYDESLGREAFESMVCQSTSTGLFAVQGGAFGHLWRAPNGTVYAAGRSGLWWSETPSQGAGGWERWESAGYVSRVFGVGEELVFGTGASAETRVLSGGSGGSWQTATAPGPLSRIHGPHAGLVYGVGHDVMARWDGAAWHEVPTGARGTFLDICVVSDDEMYAVHEGGLWEGSVHGWSERIRRRGDFLSVAKWRDQVWVGTESEGLCHLEGDQLVSVKDNQSPRMMDARDKLLLCQSEKVAGTADGVKYRAFKERHIAGLWDKQGPPHWLT